MSTGAWRVDRERGSGRGHVLNTSAGDIVGEWSWGVWQTREPQRAIQYRKYGGVVTCTASFVFDSRNGAEAWLETMATGQGETLDEITLKQYALVNPWPEAWQSGYNCALAPGLDVFRNLACGLIDRPPIVITVLDAGDGWYLATWPWGALFCGRDRSAVADIASGIAVALNTGSRHLDVGRVDTGEELLEDLPERDPMPSMPSVGGAIENSSGGGLGLIFAALAVLGLGFAFGGGRRSRR